MTGSQTHRERGSAPQPLPPPRPGGAGQSLSAVPPAAGGGSRPLGSLSARVGRHPLRGRGDGPPSLRAARTPPPEQLDALGMGELSPIAALMVRQMLFLDPPEHRRVRGLAAVAFTPRRVAVLRDHIRQIAEGLVDRLAGRAAGDDGRTGQSAARDRDRRDARRPDRRSRAAQVLVAGLRRDARQLPAQPRPGRRRCCRPSRR